MSIVPRFIENCPLEAFRHEFKVYKVTREVVGLLVSVDISEVFHKLCRSVSEIEWDRRCLSL